MQLHELKRVHKNKKSKRIGRGGKRGTYSGKGQKGQKSRSGGRMRPELRDIIKKIPKRRGYGKNRSRTVNSSKEKPVVINIGKLDKVFNEGEVISPRTLADKNLIGIRSKAIKILGNGNLQKKFIISKCLISKNAKEAIEKVGGMVK